MSEDVQDAFQPPDPSPNVDPNRVVKVALLLIMGVVLVLGCGSVAIIAAITAVGANLNTTFETVQQEIDAADRKNELNVPTLLVE
jgi:hypothetical protein